MKRNDIKISGNAFLHYFPTDKFKTNYISVNFVMPLTREYASQESLLFDVITRGTEKYPTLRDLNIHLDDCYGMGLSTDCRISGTQHIFGFAVSMLANSCVYDGSDITAEAIDMVDQVANHPFMQDGLLSSDYTEQEKEKLCERIEAKILNKARYAIGRCGEKMCEGETIGIPGDGTVESVREISAQSLTECYSRIRSQARVDVFCIGMFSEDELSRIAGLFRGYAADCTVRNTAFEAKIPGEVRYFDETKAVSQATMAMGFRLARNLDGSSDMSNAVMMNSVFGSGTVSKLFMNVREKMSLCYFCSSLIMLRAGLMYVVTGVDPANLKKTEEAVLGQLDEIAKGNITDEEFEASRMEIRNGLRSVSDSAPAIEGWYLGRILAGIDTEPENEIERILSVTKADIARAAAEVKLDSVFVLQGNGNAEAECDDEE